MKMQRNKTSDDQRKMNNGEKGREDYNVMYIMYSDGLLTDWYFTSEVKENEYGIVKLST